MLQLTKIGGTVRSKPAPSEARGAGVPRGLGLRRGAVAIPNMGVRGHSPRKFLLLTCKPVHFCVNYYAKLYAQLTRYFNQCIVLDSTLQLEWIQPTSWPIAMRKYFCNAAGYKRNFGAYKILRTQLSKYCLGCVPGGVDAPDYIRCTTVCMWSLCVVYLSVSFLSMYPFASFLSCSLYGARSLKYRWLIDWLCVYIKALDKVIL